ncbi:hypothetical protein AAY473_020938 [Plecturocebus cupreus]
MLPGPPASKPRPGFSCGSSERQWAPESASYAAGAARRLPRGASNWSCFGKGLGSEGHTLSVKDTAQQDKGHDSPAERQLRGTKCYRVSLCYPGWSAVALARLTATTTSTSQVQAILLPQPPEWLGLQAHATTLSLFSHF